MSENDIIKSPYSKTPFSEEQAIDVARCMDDPIYFIEKFVKVQHPTKGMLPLRLYPFQKDMVRAYADHRKVVALCARQLGKSLVSTTYVNTNGTQKQIKKLIKLPFKKKIVMFLEELVISLSRK